MPAQTNTPIQPVSTPASTPAVQQISSPGVVSASTAKSAFISGESVSSESEAGAAQALAQAAANRAVPIAKNVNEGKSFTVDSTQTESKAGEANPSGDEKPFTIDQFKAAITKNADEPTELELPSVKAKRIAAEKEKPVVEKKEGEEENAEETIVEEEKPVVADPAPKVEQVPAKPNLPAARDYTGLAPEEVVLAKKMSNDAFGLFQKTRAAATENAKVAAEMKKQLEDANKYVPPTYYENPDAYTLLPEYKQNMERLNTAQVINDHWEKQLLSIEEGGDWQDLAFDGKQYIVQAKQPGSAAAKMHIQKALNYVNNHINKISTDIQGMQQSFATKHNQIVNSVKEEEKKLFPHLEDSNHPDHAIVKEVLSKLESGGLHKTPLSSIFAKMVATNIRLAQQLAEQQKTSAVTAARATETIKAGPNASSLQGSGNGKISKEAVVSVNDFKALGLMDPNN